MIPRPQDGLIYFRIIKPDCCSQTTEKEIFPRTSLIETKWIVVKCQLTDMLLSVLTSCVRWRAHISPVTWDWRTAPSRSSHHLRHFLSPCPHVQVHVLSCWPSGLVSHRRAPLAFVLTVTAVCGPGRRRRRCVFRLTNIVLFCDVT